jgi:transposase-like protein
MDPVLAETRGGEDWAEVLKQGQDQGLNLVVVVKDAAKGIEAGVSEVFPQAEQRDDCFHALYELNKVRRRVLDGRGASHLSPSPVRTHRARLRQWAQDKIIHVPIEKAIANGGPVRRGADATVQTVQTVPS